MDVHFRSGSWSRNSVSLAKKWQKEVTEKRGPVNVKRAAPVNQYVTYTQKNQNHRSADVWNFTVHANACDTNEILTSCTPVIPATTHSRLGLVLIEPAKHAAGKNIKWRRSTRAKWPFFIAWDLYRHLSIIWLFREFLPHVEVLSLTIPRNACWHSWYPFHLEMFLLWYPYRNFFSLASGKAPDEIFTVMVSCF